MSGGKMPGLRYPLGMNSCTGSLGRGDRETSTRPETARPQSVPHVGSNQFTRVRRAPQWLQQSREDLSSFGAKRREPPTAAPDCDTDLQAMVHDFIENDSAEDNADGIDGTSPGATLSETLQVLTKAQSAQERELLSDVQGLLLTANESGDLMCDDDGCKGACIKWFVVKHLKVAAYAAAVCKSKWVSAGRVPGGEYEYIGVDAGERQLIVDISFQTQFEIARGTAQYGAALRSLPTVFVGTAAKLEQVLRLMSEAARASLEQSDMHLPPWRTLEYMRSKWLSPLEKLSKPPASHLHKWRASRQCVNELRRTKLSLILETKSSSTGLLSLPRGRSPRANLLLPQSS